MNKAKFYAEVWFDRLHLDRPDLMTRYIRSLPDKTRVEITVEKESEDKTAEQLGYYFSCVVTPLAEHLGYTKREMDGVLCKLLLTVNEGTDKEYVRSKADLNRVELAQFIDEAIMCAAGHGVVVCPPNKTWREMR